VVLFICRPKREDPDESDFLLRSGALLDESMKTEDERAAAAAPVVAGALPGERVLLDATSIGNDGLI
jgi:hypothetical protein